MRQASLMLSRLVAACLAAVVAHARAEVIAVPSTYTGLLGNSSPTLTFFWKGSEPKAVLLFITGGYGQIGLKPDTTERLGEFSLMLKRLSDRARPPVGTTPQ